MTSTELLLSAWDWEPSIIAGCVALLLVYAWAVRWRLPGKALYYFSGVTLLFVVLASPLDALGDEYLLSAHMVQHLTLALGIPPLLLLGIPASVMERAVSVRFVERLERILRRPLLGWTVGIGAMAVWHMPPLFNAALASQQIHILQHLCFLVTGTIFWWPIFSPLPRSRMAPVPWAVGYLFSACIACTIIGVLISFSPAVIYPAYLHPNGSAAIVSLIRDQWGISAEADHQTGGLLMYVLGCTIYVCASMAMFARWYSSPIGAPSNVTGLGGLSAENL